MKCEICGSKKDVRLFTSVFGRPPYTECRKCFLKIAKLYGKLYSKDEIEKEWQRGIKR